MGRGLAAWQVDILRRATELYPAGHERAGQLRYVQYFTSLARQNGKSELCAAFSLYALLREPKTATVVGIARSVDTANIVYDRIASIIRLVPALKDRFKKVTETRGLQLLSGGKYQMKAGTEKALQGIPVSAGLADELHLLPAKAWDALSFGTGARPNALLFGITTAGSDDSELLLRLYENAAKAEAGELERFGFSIFEAPQAVVPDDDETLAEYLRAANPAIDGGHKDLDALITTVRTSPPNEIIRYVLNRFVSSSDGFMELNAWSKVSTVELMPQGKAVIAVDRTPDWSCATFAAAQKVGEDVWTELVGTVLRPSLDSLERACVALWQTGRVQTFALDAYSLKELGNRLQGRGYPVRLITKADQYQLPATLFALTARGKLHHPGDPLMTFQLPRAGTRAEGEAYRIVRGASGSDIDAVISTAEAVYIAETQRDYGLQIG